MLHEAFPKIPIEDLTHDLAFEFTDLPLDVAVAVIRRVAIEMARSGNLLRRDMNVTIQGGVNNYWLESADCEVPVAVLGVSFVGDTCFPGRVRRFILPQWRPVGGVATWMQGNEIYFNPARDGDEFSVEFVVAPAANACELDASFQGEYYSTLLLGSKAAVLNMVDKPWSNRQLGLQLQAEYQSETQNLNVDQLFRGQRGIVQAKRPRVI